VKKKRLAPNHLMQNPKNNFVILVHLLLMLDKLGHRCRRPEPVCFFLESIELFLQGLYILTCLGQML